MTSAEPLAIAEILARILDDLGVAYVIGGSVAASFYGEPRSTLDLDIMVDLDESQASRLVASLRTSFYVDEEAAVSAARQRHSFNAVHYGTALKVDFFVSEASPFAREQLRRRRTIRVGSASLSFYAPEDLVVRKLLWFRAGNEISERQWRDVVGILRISWSQLDFALMRDVAAQVNVGDLLERAISETAGE